MSDRYYRYRCLVCNAPFDYVNDPEQACPDCEGVGGIPEPPFTTSDMHPYGGLVVCFTCGGTGKIAANVNTTDAQAKLNVNEAAKPDDLHELFYDNAADARAALEAKYAPAPVDQPDELEQQTAKLHELEAKVDATELDDAIEKALDEAVLPRRKAAIQQLLARERKAAAESERLRISRAINKVIDRAMVIVAQGRDIETRWLEYELTAALTKGETT